MVEPTEQARHHAAYKQAYKRQGNVIPDEGTPEA